MDEPQLGPSQGFDLSQASLFRQAEQFKGCCLVRGSRYAQMLTGAFLGVDLLMTATPHSGKEEDFQLFLSLLDPDRLLL
jgi:hypothetical protein